MQGNHKPAGVIITLLVAGLLGGGIGYAIGNSGSEDTSSNNSTSAPAESTNSGDGVTVGGAKMVSTLDIVDNAANASNVSTVVGLVQQAGLVETLKGAG